MQQLKLPVAWNWLQSRRDPGSELEAIAQAKLDAKAEIRAILDRHADRFAIDHKDVSAAMDYADDMLADLFHDAKSRLDSEAEADDPI